MIWFLIFNIMGTEIKDILGSMIYDKWCEKRYKYEWRVWSDERALEYLPGKIEPTGPLPHIHPVR